MPNTPLERTYEIERGSIDLKTGQFPMILATEGEASDGHVLNLRGATIPDKMPLQISHANSPLQTLGSITQVSLGTKQGQRVLRAVGEIELGGEGPQAEIRRDLAYMIAEGHLSSVSLRAEGTKVIPRRELPKNHRAYVEPTEPDMLKRYGLFFEEFTALEGSIVAVGADRNAIIGRSHETTGAVQEFWRGFVEAEVPVEDEDDEEAARIGQILSDWSVLTNWNTREIEDVRSLERYLGEMPGVSRKEAKRLASIKSETSQPSRDAEEEPKTDTPELTMEEIRTIVRGEFKNTIADIRTEVSDILNDALGRVRIR